MKRVAAMILSAVTLLLCGCVIRPAAPSDPAPFSFFPAMPDPADIPLNGAAPPTTVPPSTAPPPTAPPASDPEVPDITAEDPAEPPPPRLQKEELEEIGRMLDAEEGCISVGYLDLVTGDAWYYNGDADFYPASLVKLPFALYILKLCDSGDLDMDARLELKAGQIREGTGVIKLEEPGTEYTVRELVELMLTVSDNTAFKMLRDAVSLSDYNRFCRRELGINNITYQLMNAADCVKVLEAA